MTPSPSAFPSCAIVVLNWNGTPLLSKFQPPLLKHSPQAKVYVADNASTDGSVDMLKRDFPTVTIIQNTENFGFAGGYNNALEHVEEELYCLINSDVEVTEGWLTPVLDTFASEPETAIVQPKILDYKRKSHFEYAGAAGGFIDQFGFPFCRGRIFDEIEQDHHQYDNDADIFWASGACFFIRKEVFWRLGGFDEDFFAHQEEIDLCWRAFHSGLHTKFCHRSTVYHVGGATLEASSPRKTFLNFRNSLFMLTKNLPASKLWGILFMRLILDGLAGVKFLLQFRPAHCLAIIKAHFAFYGQLSTFLGKRKRFVPRPGYYRRKSIVVDYFLRSTRKYTDLI